METTKTADAKNPNLIKCGHCKKDFVRPNARHKYCCPECEQDARYLRKKAYRKTPKFIEAQLLNRDKRLADKRQDYHDHKEENREKRRIMRKNLTDEARAKQNAYLKQYRIDNKEVLAEKSKNDRAKNPEKNKLKCRKYYRKNKKDLLEQKRIHYVENIDELKITHKLDYDKNRVARLEQKKDYHIRNRAKINPAKKAYRKENQEVLNKKARSCTAKKKIIENQRRAKLGLPLVGEGWLHQNELRLIVQDLFSNETVITNDRGTIGMLELDIFLPDLKLAFEYNGEQHYSHITHFHKTEEIFEAALKRDKEKRLRCWALGITLIVVKYDEPLTSAHIVTRMCDAYRAQIVLQRKIVSQKTGVKSSDI